METRTSPPLPERIALLWQEARWLLLCAMAIYLALILGSFSPADPGWSHAETTSVILNAGGRLGAWLSDLLLYLFGLSAWWLVLLMLSGIMWGYRRLDNLITLPRGDRRPLIVALTGFVFLMIGSSGIEAMRFYSLKIALPLEPGGMLGHEIARLASTQLGFSGGTLILMASFAIGVTLFTGLSWLKIAEGTGLLLELATLNLLGLWRTWHDRRIGRNIAQKREAVVEIERKKIDEAPPIKIEPPALEIPRAPKVEQRIEKERQPPLFFDDTPGSILPPLHLLDEPAHDPSAVPDNETLEFTSRLIERKLADFGVTVQVLAAYPGPVITRFEIEPAVGVKGSQIVNLAKDLARALSLVSIRVVETVPGKSCMALELPNTKRQTVRLTEIIGSRAYNSITSPLALAIGKDIAGQPAVADLAKMPHLLVAGTTGSGKSVGINAMILSLLYKSGPKDVRLILVDPKMLELSVYEGIPHLLAPVVTDMSKAHNALHWCVGEMEKRYKLMSAMGVRNLGGFNNKIREAEKEERLIPNPFSLTPESPEPLATLPHIVVVIDELADLMMVVGKKVEELIARLAQKARASGIHLILATQRPSVDVITGLIKANIPTRISFQVSTKIDSRTILDQMGAEALLGQGDMLYLAPGTGLPQRVHCAFVADEEVHRVVEYLKKVAAPDYIEGILDAPPGEGGSESADGEGGAESAEADPMYDQAVEVVLKNRRPSISLVQRHLRIGYNRAARIIEQMERAGLVSSMNATGNREVLVPERSE